MPPTKQTEKTENGSQKDLVNKDGTVTKLVEMATAEVNSVEDLIQVFSEQGVEYSRGEEVTGDYRLISGAEKQLFLEKVQGQKVGIVKWQFINKPGQREFVALHCVIDGFGKFILNDSSQGGIYGDLSKITTTRLRQGMSFDRAHAGVIVDGGFKKNNEFYFRTMCSEHSIAMPGGKYKHNEQDDCTMCSGIGRAIPRSEVEDVPSAEKEKARPTWSLNFL